jgi:hypothetical protein
MPVTPSGVSPSVDRAVQGLGRRSLRELESHGSWGQARWGRAAWWWSPDRRLTMGAALARDLEVRPAALRVPPPRH